MRKIDCIDFSIQLILRTLSLPQTVALSFDGEALKEALESNFHLVTRLL